MHASLLQIRYNVICVSKLLLQFSYTLWSDFQSSQVFFIWTHNQEFSSKREFRHSLSFSCITALKPFLLQEWIARTHQSFYLHHTTLSRLLCQCRNGPRSICFNMQNMNRNMQNMPTWQCAENEGKNAEQYTNSRSLRAPGGSDYIRSLL